MDSTMDSSVEQTMQGTSKFVEHIHIMDLQPVQVSESVNNTPPAPVVIEEKPKVYVQYCRSVFPEEDVKTGIRYLNTLGVISRHMNRTILSNRINSLGLPDDFSRKILIDILVQTGNYELDDVIHAINQCLSEADGDKSDFHYPIRRCIRRPSQRLSLKTDGEDSNNHSEILYPARTIHPFMDPRTLQSRSFSPSGKLESYLEEQQNFKAKGEDSNIESDMQYPVRITRSLRKPPTLQSRLLYLSGIENKSAMEKRQSFTADGEDSNIETDLRRNGIWSYRWSWIHSLSSFISSDKDENKSVLEKRQSLKANIRRQFEIQWLTGVDTLPAFEIQPPRPRGGDTLLDFEIQPPRPKRANIRRQFEIQWLTEVDTLLDFKIQSPRPRGVTLDIRLLYSILLMTVQKSSAYDQQSVMMEIKYREQKKKKGKANGKTSKQKYVTMVFESEKSLSDDRLLKLRNENDIRIMKIQEKFERIIAQLDAKIQHGKRKRQHAPI